MTAAAVWSVTGLLQSVYFQKRTVRSPHSSSLRAGNANVPIKNRSKVFQRHLLLTSLVSTHLGGAERVAQVATYDVTTHLGGAERVAQVATYDVTIHLGGAERVAQVATYDVTTHLGGAERVAQVATYDVTTHLGGAERVAQVATYDVTPLTSEAPSG